jgi:hypothetical protein
VSGGSWELREKATAGPKESTSFALELCLFENKPTPPYTYGLGKEVLAHVAARQLAMAPGPIHCSISFSAVLELQPVPGGGDPSLGLLPLTRHQHPCFWPCLALALRPFSTLFGVSDRLEFS